MGLPNPIYQAKGFPELDKISGRIVPDPFNLCFINMPVWEVFKQVFKSEDIQFLFWGRPRGNTPLRYSTGLFNRMQERCCGIIATNLSGSLLAE
jgi:hypothetical protein